jgi:hypothetical protein
MASPKGTTPTSPSQRAGSTPPRGPSSRRNRASAASPRRPAPGPHAGPRRAARALTCEAGRGPASERAADSGPRRSSCPAPGRTRMDTPTASRPAIVRRPMCGGDSVGVANLDACGLAGDAVGRATPKTEPCRLGRAVRTTRISAPLATQDARKRRSGGALKVDARRELPEKPGAAPGRAGRP